MTVYSIPKIKGFLQMKMMLNGLITKARSLKRQGKFSFVFKAYRLLTVFRIRLKNACQDWICLVSVTLKLPWAYAYYSVGEQSRRQLFKEIDSDDYLKEVADEIYHRGFKYLEKACQLSPNYVEAAEEMRRIAILTARPDAWLSGQNRVIEYQEKRAEIAGVANLNFRIIEARPMLTTIGHTLNLDAWIKAGVLGFRPPWRTLILLEPSLKGIIANQCFLDYLKPYFEFVEDPARLSELKPLAKELRMPHEQYILGADKVVPYSHSAAVWIQAEWEKQNREPLFKLTEEHRQRGWEKLEEMGIPKGTWFATNHVRESGFKYKESYRDSEISTYLKAYEEVTSRGGWVIRVGDASMSPLPPMENVFDYALSSAKSDWMDVFLLAAARFMIGSSSGPTTLSYVFGVPIAMTNNLPTAATYLSQQDLFLPRLMRRIDDQRFLNLEELMTKPYNMGAWDTIFTNVLGVDTIPNTSEEIAELVNEMLDKLDANLYYTEEEEALQQKFKSLTAEREVMIGLPEFEIQCRLGRSFLCKYQHLLG
jgi:putative glycosyltransferase (TIGR04372 family)